MFVFLKTRWRKFGISLYLGGKKSFRLQKQLTKSTVRATNSNSISHIFTQERKKKKNREQGITTESC